MKGIKKKLKVNKLNQVCGWHAFIAISEENINKMLKANKYPSEIQFKINSEKNKNLSSSKRRIAISVWKNSYIRIIVYGCESWTLDRKQRSLKQTGSNGYIWGLCMRHVKLEIKSRFWRGEWSLSVILSDIKYLWLTSLKVRDDKVDQRSPILIPNIICKSVSTVIWIETISK